MPRMLQEAGGLPRRPRGRVLAVDLASRAEAGGEEQGREALTTARIETDLRVVGLAFFSFVVLGTPGALLNVAWTHAIRDTFRLALDAVGTLFLTTTIGYAVASFASGRLIANLGIAWLLALGSALGALGLLGIAIAPTWWAMVLFGLLVGTGAGILDGGMNIHFAANYGPRLMNWLHACYGIGATLAPLAMTAILKSGGSWRLGYGLAAVLYGVLVVLFILTRARWSDEPEVASATQPGMAAMWQTLRLPLVWLGVGLFLAYTGLEVSAGQWSFSLLTESRHAGAEVAGVWVSIYWGSFTAGRILFGASLTWIRPAALIRLCMAGAVLGAALLGWKSLAGAGFVGLALFGFSISPIFALMVTSTQERLGPVHAPNAIGLQVAAAALGVGVLPGLAGVLAKRLGLEVIPQFLLAVTLMMIVLFEAIHRHRPEA
jgi:fucose permease